MLLLTAMVNEYDLYLPIGTMLKFMLQQCKSRVIPKLVVDSFFSSKL